jgi:hypothetical protein
VCQEVMKDLRNRARGGGLDDESCGPQGIHQCNVMASLLEGRNVMRKLIIAIAMGAVLSAGVSSVLAGQPPGQRGYEGQPGHQGGGQHAPGLLGYEGQPGNQGG